MHSKLPCRRRDEGYRSVGESGIPRSKEILRIQIRLSYKGCKEEKNKNKWRGCRLFFFFFFFVVVVFFVLFIAVEIDSKLTLHHMGKVLLFNLPR